MAFAEDLRVLAARVSEFRTHISGKNQTKNTLIMPFLTALGYDVFNPLHVVPAFSPDIALMASNGRLEKVDYALLGAERQPLVLIDAKPLGTPLDNDDLQLSRFFSTVPTVQFGVITDGCVYRFFTDLDASGVMDSRPFYQFDLRRFQDEDIEILQRFHRSMHDGDKLRALAEDLRYGAAFRRDLTSLIQQPSPDFVRLLMAPHYDGQLRPEVVARFTPLVRQAFLDAIGGMITIGAPRATGLPEYGSDGLPPDCDGQPTEDELAFYERAQAILADRGVNPVDVIFRDTAAYFSLSFIKPAKWFLRGCFEAECRNVLTLVPVERARELVPGAKVDAPSPGMGVSRVYETNPDKLADLIWESFVLKDSMAAAPLPWAAAAIPLGPIPLASMAP